MALSLAEALRRTEAFQEQIGQGNTFFPDYGDQQLCTALTAIYFAKLIGLGEAGVSAPLIKRDGASSEASRQLPEHGEDVGRP